MTDNKKTTQKRRAPYPKPVVVAAPTRAEARQIDWAARLQRDGIIVVPVLSEAQLRARKGEFDDALHESPYIKPEHIEDYAKRPVLASFGASGDPTVSWNSEVAAETWRCVLDWVKEHLRSWTTKANVCVYPDRTGQRSTWNFDADGAFVKRESDIPAQKPHTDAPRPELSECTVLAGWVGVLGESAFVGAPGSVDPQREEGFLELSSDEMHQWMGRMRKYLIPEGYGVFFDPRTVHCVAPAVIADHQRIFHCVCFTDKREPPLPGTHERVQATARWQMPTGGECRMIEANHYRSWMHNRVLPYSEWFVDAVPRTKGGGIPSVLDPPQTYGLPVPEHCQRAMGLLARLVTPQPLRADSPLPPPQAPPPPPQTVDSTPTSPQAPPSPASPHADAEDFPRTAEEHVRAHALCSEAAAFFETALAKKRSLSGNSVDDEEPPAKKPFTQNFDVNDDWDGLVPYRPESPEV